MPETSLKPPKTSALVKEDKPELFETINYTEDELKYIREVKDRLEKAKNNRDKNHEEFDSLSYIDYWWANERWGNTQLRAVANKEETNFQSGTLRTKMMALLASLESLNLSPNITAFNENDIPINRLGQTIEDIIEKTEEAENDEEKKMLRHYENLKHGYIFVEDLWQEPLELKKEIVKGDYGDITGVKWTPKLEKRNGLPERQIIPGPAVYLGDIKKYFIEQQPFIFTVEIKKYEAAEKTFGEFERWKYVQKSHPAKMVDTNWRLMSELKAGEAEILRYQDKQNNEFQIFINGIPMLPIGYPLSEAFGECEYSIVQQNLEPIRHDFAYGKSFVFKNKNIIAVLDQMMRLAVLKTQKSFLPPYLNLSQRVISRDIFMPGKVTRGIAPNEIQPINPKEVEGVTNSELAMIQEVIRFVDRNTVSQTFTGAQEAGGGNVTATQIVELQRQARLMLGLTILSATLLEKKLTAKRMKIILGHWFDPVDQILDQARNILKNKYRITSRQKMIRGRGLGLRMTIPTEELPTSEQVAGYEKEMEIQIGMPAQMIFLSPEQLKEADLVWMITINPKEKRSSELSKVLFGTMINDAMRIGLQLNPAYLEERFAEMWEEDPTKMFQRAMPGIMPPGAPGAPPGQPGAPGATPPPTPAPAQAPRVSIQAQPSPVLR